MRKLIILTAPRPELGAPSDILWLANAPFSAEVVPFSCAKTLLGREFPQAVYDMRAEQGVCLNLEALAIVAGTISQGGTLFLLCPNWANLANELDEDSLRWHAKTPISTPHFHRYFQALIAEFQFEIDPLQLPKASGLHSFKFCKFTAEQQRIFNALPRHPAEVHFITAPRGRGKSTLAGKLAHQLLANNEKVLICAKSRNALGNLLRELPENVPFFAPDHLLSLVNHQQISADHWLFLDEAAALPLPMLKTLCAYFAKVILTTTTQNYEGTGRGFCLKLLPELSRPTQHWTLTTPLRWQENDPLEAFIHRLLMLEGGENSPKIYPPSIQDTAEFYALLAQAHYKTTPTDLRRLFDAPDQHYVKVIENQQLIAGAWLVKEGCLDETLTEAIWRGERRPQGNLLAQYLCAQGGFRSACRLHSMRISRLAVTPFHQRQGIGKRLILDLILQSKHKASLDFLSVSFGLTAPLLAFWLGCGFRLVQLSQFPEASSGYHSAMMIFPLSPQGEKLAQQASTQFKTDLPLLPLPEDLQKMLNIAPLAEDEIPLFTEQDRQNLQDFATTSRTFASCYASLKRFYAQNPSKIPLLSAVFEHNGTLPQGKKGWVKNLKNAIMHALFSPIQER